MPGFYPFLRILDSIQIFRFRAVDPEKHYVAQVFRCQPTSSIILYMGEYGKPSLNLRSSDRNNQHLSNQTLDVASELNRIRIKKVCPESNRVVLVRMQTILLKMVVDEGMQ